MHPLFEAECAAASTQWWRDPLCRYHGSALNEAEGEMTRAGTGPVLQAQKAANTAPAVEGDRLTRIGGQGGETLSYMSRRGR